MASKFTYILHISIHYFCIEKFSYNALQLDYRAKMCGKHLVNLIKILLKISFYKLDEVIFYIWRTHSV